MLISILTILTDPEDSPNVNYPVQIENALPYSDALDYLITARIEEIWI